MFGEGKFLVQKNGEGKGEKFLEKENIWLLGGEEERRRKKSKIFGEGKYLVHGEEEERRRKRRKIF